METYPVPDGEAEALIEVKKSRFIASAAGVTERRQAMAFLQRMRERYPDARHHCWAYLLGDPRASCDAAMNDDGEPSGTAGKPILNVLQHKGVGDVAVVVVRYFGGIKLGAGGLTRAYSAAAEAVMSALPLAEHEPMLALTLECAFAEEQLLRRWATAHGAAVGTPHYGRGVSLPLQLPARLEPELEAFCLSRGMIYRRG